LSLQCPWRFEPVTPFVCCACHVLGAVSL